MRLFKTRLAILVLALVFSSCEFLPFFSDSKKKKDDDEDAAQSWGISFDITGAKAIAATGTTSSGAISAAARAALDRATDADAALVKVMEDGSIVDAIDTGETGVYIPKVSFVTVGADGSVYVCFEYAFWVNSGDSGRFIQFIRIYPDATKPFDILWPPESTDSTMSPGSVRTWTWWGMDEILSIVVDEESGRFPGQAAFPSTRSPFTNLIPASTRGMSFDPSSLRQPFSASLQSL